MSWKQGRYGKPPAKGSIAPPALDGERDMGEKRGMLKRDAYHDYMTGAEAMRCVSFEDVNRLRLDRLDALVERSGAGNVSNATLRQDEALSVDAVTFAISFDSRAWTGLLA